jgi:hypothetical protein
MTKVWPQGEFPLRQIAKMTLNRNVSPGALQPLIHPPNKTRM